jgi:hypothetical protein
MRNRFSAFVYYGFALTLLLTAPARAADGDHGAAGEYHPPHPVASLDHFLVRYNTRAAGLVGYGGDFLELAGVEFEGPYGAIVGGVTNLDSSIHAGEALRDAEHFYGQVVDYCGRIIDEAQTLQSAGDARWRAADDLGECCLFSSNCRTACTPPDSGTVGNATIAFISNLPEGNVLMDALTDKGSAQSRFRSTAINCVECSERALRTVKNAVIRGNQVLHCGGWRP